MATQIASKPYAPKRSQTPEPSNVRDDKGTGFGKGGKLLFGQKNKGATDKIGQYKKK